MEPSRGEATELSGILLQIKNPRARLSRTENRGNLFSSLGELMWYLAATKDLAFISYYINQYKNDSEDNKTIYGGYGPRLFNARGQNQIENVLALLKEKPHSRRAVIQLFDAEDIAIPRKEIPCTCTLQFMIRENHLHMLTNMRSNDAFLGLPHDVFTFTMLQEIMARSLAVELGPYKHSVGSLHLYARNIAGAKQFLEEGWQSNVPMPSMPMGDPWPSIKQLLDAEAAIRQGYETKIPLLDLDPYWADLVRLLQIFRRSKDNDTRKISSLKRKMASRTYDPYIGKKQSKNVVVHSAPEQLDLPAILETIPDPQ
ncbi:MAG: thymidylate synthase [Desulforhabdus sp.]|nr:thymidylate synthase [Desulforhabdus sp.]